MKPFLSVMRILGISIGSYEVNCVLIPIYRQAKSKRNFIAVQNSVLGTVIVLYIAVGLLCYLAYGANAKGPITITLDQTKWYIKIVEVVYVVALLLTVMLQLFPAIEIILRYTSNRMKRGMGRTVIESIIRASIMSLCIVLAVVFGENFDTVLSVVGNIFCAPLSCIMPALLHYRLAAITTTDKVRNIALLSFGIICMISIVVLMVIDYT